MSAAELRHRVAFDREALSPDGFGGMERAWVQVHECAAAMRYQHGTESVQAGALTGTASFKVWVRASSASRALRPADRMRDVRRGMTFNIREVDAITDPARVWIVAEAGVAT